MKTRKNLLVAIVTLLLMCFCLSGCAGGDHESAYIDDDDEPNVTEELQGEDVITVRPFTFLGKFKIQEAGITQYIFYDPDNLVMYSYFSGTNDRGLEPMVNPDGTYKIYDPETWMR